MQFPFLFNYDSTSCEALLNLYMKLSITFPLVFRTLDIIKVIEQLHPTYKANNNPKRNFQYFNGS